MQVDQMPKLSATHVDVLLILEGTFPLVQGGVSVWVEQLIRSMPTVKFGAIFLGSDPDAYDKVQCQIPKNLAHLETHFLFAKSRPLLPTQKEEKSSNEKQTIAQIKELHELFFAMQRGEQVDFSHVFGHGDNQHENLFDEKNFLYSKEAWEYILMEYEAHSIEPSFIDYFWTVRNVHAPLWMLDKIARTCIRAKLVHTPSTGYAGLLASLCSRYHDIPMITTEHGIYTRERFLELLAAPLSKQITHLEKISKDIDYLNNIWLRFFDALSRLCYNESRYVISLYRGARRIQVASGADSKKCRIIPNGVDIDRYSPLAKTKNITAKTKMIVGLIGHLVRVKSILNFIQAFGILATQRENVEAWVCYLNKEDELYVHEIERLIENLNLHASLKLVEGKSALELLKDIDLLVVSSVSEGMPFNILEAFAAGVPAVVTNVGSCAELVIGKTEEDRALGASGIVVPSGNSVLLAEAMNKILTSPDTYDKMSQVAQARVNRYYNKAQMISAYQEIYREFL